MSGCFGGGSTVLFAAKAFPCAVDGTSPSRFYRLKAVQQNP